MVVVVVVVVVEGAGTHCGHTVGMVQTPRRPQVGIIVESGMRELFRQKQSRSVNSGRTAGVQFRPVATQYKYICNTM